LEVGWKRGPVLAVCLDSRDVHVREAVAVALEELKAKLEGWVKCPDMGNVEHEPRLRKRLVKGGQLSRVAAVALAAIHVLERGLRAKLGERRAGGGIEGVRMEDNRGDERRQPLDLTDDSRPVPGQPLDRSVQRDVRQVGEPGTDIRRSLQVVKETRQPRLGANRKLDRLRKDRQAVSDPERIIAPPRRLGARRKTDQTSIQQRRAIHRPEPSARNEAESRDPAHSARPLSIARRLLSRFAGRTTG